MGGRIPSSAVPRNTFTLAAAKTPLRLGAPFSSVPKVYIGALEDRAVPPALQQRLAKRALAAQLDKAGEHLRNLGD